MSASMMHGDVTQLAFTQTGTPAIEVPYDGGAFSLLIVMPDDLQAFDASLNADSIDKIVAQLAVGNVTLTLPKLTFSTSRSVLEPLQALGLPLDAGHWVIWHSAKIEVDEAGTIAAAMTSTSHTPASVVQSTPFTVDRPFAFFIRDNASGSILFGGRVVDPTAM